MFGGIVSFCTNPPLNRTYLAESCSFEPDVLHAISKTNNIVGGTG